MSEGKGQSAKWQRQNQEIVERLGVDRLLSEYRRFGVRFASDTPRASGMISAYAIGREDRKPSAWVNTVTGQYGDSSSSTGSTFSFFDFAARYGGFVDWKTARDHYAKEVGVKLGKSQPNDNWRDRLKFFDWSDERCDRYLLRWCTVYKPGISPEAVRAAGGRIATLCFRRKNKETEKFEFQPSKWICVCLPAWGEGGVFADPQAWICWPAIAANFEFKDSQPKMLSIGPTAGTMLGLHGLVRLTSGGGEGDEKTEVKIVWKTAGPTDMLALWSIIPPELRESHLVVTNGSTETGDVFVWQSQLFAGHRAAIAHDGDEAGELGLLKWAKALRGVAADVKIVRPFSEVKPKGGEDSRDVAVAVMAGSGKSIRHPEEWSKEDRYVVRA